MQTASLNAIGTQGQQNPGGQDAFQKVDLNDFVKLLVTELKQQDPLNPMDNSQILQQVSQIREIESNQRLTDTLQAVLLGQNLSTASGLLSREVVAMDDEAKTVTGRVDRVSIEDGTVKLHIGQQTVSLKNVSQILTEGATKALESGSSAVAP